MKAYDGSPGQYVRHRTTGSRAVLDVRKEDGSGWWLRHNAGGLGDEPLAAGWDLLDEFEPPDILFKGETGVLPGLTENRLSFIVVNAPPGTRVVVALEVEP